MTKGVSKCVIKKSLRHDMYKYCLFNESETVNSMQYIRSHNHELYIDEEGNNLFHDKRFWKDSVNSYPFGHYKNKKNI